MTVNSKDSNRRLLLLSAFLCLSFILLAIFVQNHPFNSFDNFFIKLFSQKQHHLKQIANQISTLASPSHDLLAAAVLSLVIGAASVLSHHRYKVFPRISLLLGSTVLSCIINLLLKPEFGRIRPLGKGDGFSFPSNHAMMICALLFPVVYLLCKQLSSLFLKRVLWGIAFVCTLAVGLSRVYLEKHYMTDVIGAFLIAGAVFCLLLAFLQRRFMLLRQ